MTPLVTVVTEAVAWATTTDAGRAAALAQLAKDIAAEMGRVPTEFESGPPVAALAKELRATLVELDGLRDGDQAESSLAAVLSTPVWDAEKPRPANRRPARGKGGNSAAKATDAVAKPRGGRRRRDPA